MARAKKKPMKMTSPTICRIVSEKEKNYYPDDVNRAAYWARKKAERKAKENQNNV